MKCQHCNRETSNKKFCSRSCATTVNNSRKPKRKRKPRHCAICNVAYFDRRTSKFCAACGPRYGRPTTLGDHVTIGDLVEQFGEGRHRSYVHAWVRLDCCRKYGSDRKPCVVCDYDTYTELCHIKAISKFDLTATLGEINARENIVYLCPNHHKELDRKLMSEVDRQTINDRNVQ